MSEEGNTQRVRGIKGLIFKNYSNNPAPSLSGLKKSKFLNYPKFLGMRVIKHYHNLLFDKTIQSRSEDWVVDSRLSRHLGQTATETCMYEMKFFADALP